MEKILDDKKQYMSIRDAADLLSVSTQTLRNWERRGEFVPYRNPINKYRMYEVKQIEEFLEQMRTSRIKRGRFKLKVVSLTD